MTVLEELPVTAPDLDPVAIERMLQGDLVDAAPQVDPAQADVRIDLEFLLDVADGGLRIVERRTVVLGQAGEQIRVGDAGQAGAERLPHRDEIGDPGD